MNSASELIDHLGFLGVTLTVDGSELVLRPGGNVPADLIPEIREWKPDLIRCLEPSLGFGDQAPADARNLAGLIDKAPNADLETIRGRARELGITGLRWPFALCALPERLNMPRN